MLKRLFEKFFDYDIVDHYMTQDSNGHYQVKYRKRYKFRRRSK